MEWRQISLSLSRALVYPYDIYMYIHHEEWRRSLLILSFIHSTSSGRGWFRLSIQCVGVLGFAVEGETTPPPPPSFFFGFYFSIHQVKLSLGSIDRISKFWGAEREGLRMEWVGCASLRRAEPLALCKVTMGTVDG